ncbi:hypothetical protein FACS1894200_05300 [Spirochaetia bacterium]|nr:hypothetical protein FACS1894200_05300 [Spirochaetia bacterium]
MKKVLFICLFSLCAAFAFSQSPSILDAAILDAANFFITVLPQDSTIAITGIEEAKALELSKYINQELLNHFDNSKKFTIVQPEDLNPIKQELQFNNNGDVDAASAKRIYQLFGPQTIITGRIVNEGGSYRITVYAAQVDKGTSLVQENTVRLDRQLLELLDPQFATKDYAMKPYERYNNGVLSITKTGENDVGYEGERLRFQIQASKDCYIIAYRVTVDGRISLVYPAGKNDKTFLAANETRTILDSVPITLASPYGNEYLLVAAYEKSFSIMMMMRPVPVNRRIIDQSLAVSAIGNDGASVSIRSQSSAFSPPLEPISTVKYTYSVLPRP